ncbi:hypothetical protein [Brevundimonas sp.]|uniref:hypothetical protein n=1 Tax=Brevundimonas sp. TaxID=1871086 RepID=UPI0028A1AF92|nr:hypothetical protein [Brevundimonas sp.]
MDQDRNPLSFLRNLAINLKATGPAAAVCVWFMSMAAVAIWVNERAGAISSFIGIGGMMVLLSMAQNPPRQD